MTARTLTVWCPDWPLVALGIPADDLAAVLVGDEVLAATAAARADGVRQGIRRREAQRRSPAVRMVDRDEGEEARVFERVLTALDPVCPRVEVVRPGLAVMATKGPARYFGGDAVLAQVVADAVHDVLEVLPALSGRTERGAQVGVADGVFASMLAARSGTVVPAGESAAFLAPFPVAVLDAPDLADLLRRLGLFTLGAVAALPAKHLATRFGTAGARAHRLSRGLDGRAISAQAIPPELAVLHELDPPVDQVEPLAFVAKMLADELHAGLTARGLGCTRVLVEAETEHGERRSRLWRHDGVLTPAEVAQRVRWQLGGWLTGPAGERPSAGITLLRLSPDEVHRDIGRQLALWGDATDADDRAAGVLARLQGLLGFDAVCIAVPAGGRSPAEQVRLIPWGEPRPAVYAGTPPWPGRLPAPSPTLVHPDPHRADVLDGRGTPVRVDDRGVITGAPQRLVLRGARPLEVVAWAGPWLVDERWWDATAHRRVARFQIVTADGAASLLGATGEQWWVEAVYD